MTDTEIQKAIQEFEDNAYHNSRKQTISEASKAVALRALYDVAELRKQRLAENETAEESGLLVRLPCKVGDTVYEVIGGRGGEIWEMTVTKYEIDKDGITIYLADEECDDYGDESYINCFGKSVFLTREEAEAALKGAEK